MPTPRLIAGCMSGTSADGVDCAIVEVAGRGLAMTAKPLAHAYEPFAAELRTQILDVRQKGEVRLADLAEIGRQVTLAHVRAFRAAIGKANVTADQIAAIAAHGQTLYHGPPNTMQYFDPSLLAYETDCAVVSDFRRADLAAGGQGAPLVPFADWILFRHPTRSRAIVNIGGIANITCLWPNCTLDQVWAFDIGPGNCISDYLMRTRSPCGASFDAGGEVALTGRVNLQLFDAMMDHAFFVKLGTKSTDGPEMIAVFETARTRVANGQRLSLADELATVNYLAAAQISRALHLFGGQFVGDLFISGGGLQNAALMQSLRLSAAPVLLTAEAITSTGGTTILPSLDLAASREAIAFALLAAATLDGEPSNVPSATGASRRVVLGSITPRQVLP